MTHELTWSVAKISNAVVRPGGSGSHESTSPVHFRGCHTEAVDERSVIFRCEIARNGTLALEALIDRRQRSLERLVAFQTAILVIYREGGPCRIRHSIHLTTP
jgi:hypothetical protein